ncbi:22991_t:CDS:2 [Cetraspora pellucida]|uniref:22991_t:CDS:1 n=1 Tax=Cetraspora pellucida TaxID=1433469 RepID=A0A9N9BVW8_9GLOM|nr:22991_t:CDS:2 [Cetraspora pellucida]
MKLEKNYLNININYLKLNQESNLIADITSFTFILILEIQKQFQCNSFINTIKIFKLLDKLLNSQNILKFGNKELKLLLNFYGKPQLPLFLLAIVNSNNTYKK